MDKNRLTQVGRALKELGVQIIPAIRHKHADVASAACHVARRLPQELRLAGIDTLDEANRFLQQQYLEAFNEKFAVAAEQKGTAFRKTSRADLDWIFSVQTGRVAAKDNMVAIGDRVWQIEKSRFRSTLPGCSITIHEHLDGRVSLQCGPQVVGQFDANGRPLSKGGERRGKDHRADGDGPLP